MSEWLEKVKAVVPGADEAAVAGIVKHCGVALKSKDASLVSCTDKGERDRVRDSFLKKKLGLAQSDGELDKAVEEVCMRLKDSRDKPRVTFYYLLAEKYGKLDLFK